MPSEVVVHPLVLLSVVDHYNRVARGTKKRVVGILLGESHKGKIDVTNSYAVPFEEDRKDPSIWYLDHNYHENMFRMFKKVNAKERVVGWYSTGPKICPADLEINELIRKYNSDPALVIIDVNPQDNVEIPTRAYVSVATPPEEQNTVQKRTFTHIPATVGAYEAEEVGVEHLLRNIRDSTESTVAAKVVAKIQALKGMKKRMDTMHTYLQNVTDGKLPANPEIIYNMQDIFNLLPDLRVETLVSSLAINTNDNMLVLYLASLIRSIMALHTLITNKLNNRMLEQKEREALEKSDKKTEEDSKAKEKNDDVNEKIKDNDTSNSNKMDTDHGV